MNNETQHGYLVLADISGYTSYLAGGAAYPVIRRPLGVSSCWCIRTSNMKLVRSRKFAITLGVLSIAILTALLLWSFVLRHASPPTHADIPYMADDEPRHRVDVYLPTQTQAPFLL